MTGYQKLCAMKFLHILFLYVYMTKALLAPMAACKMVQQLMIVRHGVCQESACAFAVHGTTECGFLENYDEGCRAGKIAAATVKKLKIPALCGRVNPLLLCAAASMFGWAEPLQSTLPPLVLGLTILQLLLAILNMP